MRIRPVSPTQRDLRAGHCFGMERSRFRSDLAFDGGASALQVNRGDILHGSVGDDLAADALGCPLSHVWVLIRLVKLWQKLPSAPSFHGQGSEEVPGRTAR